MEDYGNLKIKLETKNPRIARKDGRHVIVMKIRHTVDEHKPSEWRKVFFDATGNGGI